MNSLAGHLLIASPYLSDGNFFRSVVLIVSHDDEHAFGLLLNRPGHATLCDAWEKITGDRCDQEIPVRTGGPLDGTLMVLHQFIEHSDAAITSDIHLSSSWESVTDLIQSGSDELVPVSGYSGWGPSQLDQELDVGGWMTLPATPEIVFADPSDQWQLSTRHVGDEIMGGVPMRHAPKDTRWN